MPVRAGEVLAGKYLVERVLGAGGMGIVVAARHLQLAQPVALKFLLPEALHNPDVVARFLREARHAAQLRSEHVARIIDVGTLAGGAPYIVMELLEGGDLGALLAHQGPLAIPVAVDAVLQACDAIAEAHALGIIHRDLKPQNLFATRRNDGASLVKVLDFGISKSTTPGADFAATRTQAVMGSPAYMSPEQMRSAKLVDARSDIWALGIILYELVVGRVPWDAETFTELCFKVAMDPLPAFPRGAVPHAGFEGVVRRCLEKDPAQRYADVHALALALAPFAPPHAQCLVERIGRVLHGHASAVAAVQPTIVAPGSGTLGDAAGQRTSPTMSSPRRRFTGLALGGALAAALVGATALVAGGSSDRTAAAPPARPVAPVAAVPPPPVAPAAVPAAAPVAAVPAPASVTPPQVPMLPPASTRDNAPSATPAQVVAQPATPAHGDVQPATPVPVGTPRAAPSVVAAPPRPAPGRAKERPRPAAPTSPDPLSSAD
jgi:serine/threonine-protein kinase